MQRPAPALIASVLLHAGVIGIAVLASSLGWVKAPLPTVTAVPVSIVLWNKLLYLVPAVAIEQLGGLEAMKRSWSLTKGSFWRTFGYAVLPNLAVTAVLWVVNASVKHVGSS